MRIVNKIRFYYNQLVNYYTFKKHHVIINNYFINGILHVVNNGGQITIGNNFTANSGKMENPIGGDNMLHIIIHRKNATLTIGDNVGISNSTIVCWEKIEIGNNVVIGGSCKIWDTNFHSLNPVMRTSRHDTDIKTSPIKIDDNVFIGGNVMILKGVTIGENSIIAAGSVVTKSIPANVIAGGNPCKIIKTLP